MPRRSMEVLVDILQTYYAPFRGAREGGPPVAWVSAFTPVEILDAHGIDYYFPESYAATVAASGKEGPALYEAASQQLDLGVCGYAAAFNGTLAIGSGPKGRFPRPDILVATNNQCGTAPNWWAQLAETLGCPIVTLDYPNPRNGGAEALSYIVEQHRELMATLSMIFGARFSQEILDRSMKNSVASVDTWRSVLEARRDGYAPARHFFDNLLPMVIRRSDERTQEFNVSLRSELAAIIAEHEGTRLLWYGYPSWHSKGRILDGVESAGVRVVADDYSAWWNLRYEGTNWEEALARAYSDTPLNRSNDERIETLSQMIEDLGIDGVILSANRSCRRSSTLMPVVKRALRVPSVILEMDMIDRTFPGGRSVAMAVEAFMEVL